MTSCCQAQLLEGVRALEKRKDQEMSKDRDKAHVAEIEEQDAREAALQSHAFSNVPQREINSLRATAKAAGEDPRRAADSPG